MITGVLDPDGGPAGGYPKARLLNYMLLQIYGI